MTRKAVNRSVPAFIAFSLLAAAVSSRALAPVTHTMSGVVVGLDPAHHASIRAEGPTTRTAMTRSDGTWEMRNVKPGVYLVRATHRLYTISPPSHRADVSLHDVGNITFRATPIEGGAGAQTGAGTAKQTDRFDMTGRIDGIEPNLRPTIRAAGPVIRSVQVRSDGTWQISNLVPGDYAVSPHHSRYDFTPDVRRIIVRTADVHNVNFTARLLPPGKR
jgi:hypothetical protein